MKKSFSFLVVFYRAQNVTIAFRRRTVEETVTWIIEWHCPGAPAGGGLAWCAKRKLASQLPTTHILLYYSCLRTQYVYVESMHDEVLTSCGFGSTRFNFDYDTSFNINK